MTEVGGIWSPWINPNEKGEPAMDKLIESASVKTNFSPPMLAGKEPPDIADVEAIMALTITMLEVSQADPLACLQAAMKDDPIWRVMVSSVMAKTVSGEAREMLDSARLAYRRTLN